MALKDIVAGAGSLIGSAGSAVGGFLSGFAWKIGTAAGVIGCIVLTGFLIAEKVDNARLGKQVASLSAEINDPQTGYVAKLAQCRTNVSQIETELQSQNAEIAAKSAADQTTLAASQKALNDAREQIKRLEGAAAATLAYVPQGASPCERTLDVINHYIEDRR